MNVYYNEIDPFAVAWLRELMAADCIPHGFIDTRSIVDVQPDDLLGYDHCHFFAGIGGWAQALQLNAWPEDRQVWTGSCPCQPFSVAGKGKGEDDERHLWPEFYRLITAAQPAIIFGEQVASKSGRDWLSAVRSDLEAVGYGVGAADLCAASVGAPHIRQRIYFGARRLANTNNPGSQRRGLKELSERASKLTAGEGRTPSSSWAPADFLACKDGRSRPVEPGTFPLAHGVSNRVGLLRGYGNAIVPQVAEVFIRSFTEALAAKED